MDRPAKILIVEDEFLISLDLRMQLSKMGYQVCTLAGSGEEAVQIAAQETPDVVLMDLHLAGEIDGLVASRQIVAQTGAAILFMTGYIGEDTGRDIETLQPLACLVKPIRIREVHEAISAWLEQKVAIKPDRSLDALNESATS